MQGPITIQMNDEPIHPSSLLNISFNIESESGEYTEKFHEGWFDGPEVDSINISYESIIFLVNGVKDSDGNTYLLITFVGANFNNYFLKISDGWQLTGVSASPAPSDMIVYNDTTITAKVAKSETCESFNNSMPMGSYSLEIMPYLDAEMKIRWSENLIILHGLNNKV